jgi:hypothetical protein
MPTRNQITQSVVRVEFKQSLAISPIPSQFIGGLTPSSLFHKVFEQGQLV